MTPHIQSLPNNCFATCIASILDIPADDVPNFYQLQDDTGRCMMMLADEWLRVRRKRFLSIELCDGAHYKTDQVIMNRFAHQNDELVILSGVSPRPKEDGTTRYHSVVGKPVTWGFEIVHDPHPDGTGLVGQPYSVKWILPVFDAASKETL